MELNLGGALLQRESEWFLSAAYLHFEMDALEHSPQSGAADIDPERLSYSIKESAALLGVDYFSVYRLIQRGKLRACRALRGKLLIPRSELLRLLSR